MSDWINGSPRDVALSFEGDVTRYVDLRRAVGAARLPDGDGAVGCPAGIDHAATLTTVLAALDRGRPVIVGADQAAADRVASELPLGTALALATSGSSSAGATGRLVARTDASWLASAAPLAEIAGLGSDDRFALTGPLHVSMHLYAALHALWLGATIGDTLAGATAAQVTPTRLARLLNAGATPSTVIVAGAALPDAVRERAAARGIRLVEYYGAAELSFVLAGPAGAMAPFPGVEVELRPAGTPAGLGVPAELWARSPYLALDVVGSGGMLRRDAAGFATVGDLAERTDATYRVLGRGDAAITTAGATVVAEAVEARLLALPGVEAVAVLGQPHELLGERVVAVVELTAGGSIDRIASLARPLLATAELPRRWIAATLPRTSSGKVARGALRDALANGSLGEPTESTGAARNGAVR
ncbi:AMP-binding protein [Agromyces sp. CFH 90414]|uniref:AMP-binding protein n=1 Tax=Agromyces agglutinans TaxID=2662258 RepID=A0A6I2F2U3_9MICO|nr:AMP-binding protein [Agromyces agglutinans]MRG58842.1 AMP-binding protein [Agromyces agglutinans]